MDESLDSEAEARAKAEGRSCVPTEGRPGGWPLLIRGAGGVKKVAAEEWSQLPLFELDELARVFPAE